MLILCVLFSVLLSSLSLIGATEGMLSEATLFPDRPWTEWKGSLVFIIWNQKMLAILRSKAAEDVFWC